MQKVTVKTNKQKPHQNQTNKMLNVCQVMHKYKSLFANTVAPQESQNAKQRNIYAKVNWNSLPWVALAAKLNKTARHWSDHSYFDTTCCESPIKIRLETELRYWTKERMWQKKPLSLQLAQLHTVKLGQWNQLVVEVCLLTSILQEVFKYKTSGRLQLAKTVP